jgi:hypothetical protein
MNQATMGMPVKQGLGMTEVELTTFDDLFLFCNFYLAANQNSLSSIS